MRNNFVLGGDEVKKVDIEREKDVREEINYYLLNLNMKALNV